MGKPEDDKVQRYFDGELSPEEESAFEATLGDEDRERLAALGELHGLVANTLAAEAADVDLWAGIEGGLALERARERRGRLRRRVGASAGMALAIVASLIFLFGPLRQAFPTNECDIELMDVDGAQATVLRVPDAHQEEGATTTIIWTEED